MRRIVAGVMGPGETASDRERRDARDLGRAIAAQGWVLLTGGRDQGVMHAASQGAKEAGGLTIGILPTSEPSGLSNFVDVAILTGLGQARNNINVLSSTVIFVCGMGPGTASEASLALKAGRNIILVTPDENTARFFTSLDPTKVQIGQDVARAIEIARQVVEANTERA